MKGKKLNPTEAELGQIDKFVLRHMRDFICDSPSEIPQEIKQILREKFREVATHRKSEHLAKDIAEDFHKILKNNPALYEPKKTAKKTKNTEVIYVDEKNLCPNIISSDLSDGATLIENKYGFFDVYCIKPQLLKNKTQEQIRFNLIATGRGTRILKNREKLIVAPQRGNIGTLIEQEFDGDSIFLTYQLIIMPQLELTKEDNDPEQDFFEPLEACQELEM